MAKLFDSPRLTLIRAKHHIADFSDVVNKFRAEKPWTFFIDEQSDTGNTAHKIRFLKPLPEMLPCIVFDVVNNLRAVLDQSGFASAVASGKILPKRTNFPFGDCPAELDNNAFGRKASNDCPPEITMLFLSFCPYKGSNNSLWTTNKLCDAKKHCALIPINIANAAAHFWTDVSMNELMRLLIEEHRSNLRWNAAKSEMTLLIIPPEMQIDIRGNFAFDVAIDGVEIQGIKSAIRVLNAMASEVESVMGFGSRVPPPWLPTRLKRYERPYQSST